MCLDADRWEYINCHRLRVLTGHSEMAPGYHKAGKNISTSLDNAKTGSGHYLMPHFIINDASHVANNAINSLKNYEHLDASEGDQFSLSDIKTLRSNGEEQTITEITAVLTDRALERRDRHCEESKLQICQKPVQETVRDKTIVTTMIQSHFRHGLLQNMHWFVR